MVNLNGKTALVTGAARGIGRASACAFAAAGANLVLVDVNEVGLLETESMVRAIGREVLSMKADVTNSEQMAGAVDAAVRRFEGVDCALNNAAFFPERAQLADVDESTARRVMEVDYWGVFHCMRAEIPAMLRQGGGTIVNISSGAGLVGFPDSSIYCAAKHAVIGLTRAAAIDYGSRGVRINAICPGMVLTPPLMEWVADERVRTAVLAMHPIGRLAEPSEIADAVIWLSSPQSSFVVGACVPVDGGFTAR